MTEALFVLSLALLAFGLVNSLLSFMVVVGVRWLRFDCRPRARARRYLLVRAFPAAASLVFIAGFFMPVLCRHEPGNAGEQLSLTMGLLAAAAVTILLAAIIRGLRSMWVTYQLAKSWESSARPLELKGFPISACVIDNPFPVVAIVGIARRRLYVARKVLANCSAEEFDAILSHERAHIRHSDNLSRLILRCFPDLLALTATANWLERGWAQATEEAADDDAVAAGKGLALAAALCKVARLARGQLPVAAMALHGDGDVAHRIDRLIRPEKTAITVLRGRLDWLRFVILLAAPIIVASTELARVHAFTEALVGLLK
jgi:Zn-dependent protease with chaperone function